jgi:RimJ/RimL family protein N-acetyltransferase
MSSVSIRPATMNDARMLLRWKNDPVVRKFSIISHEKIKLRDHIKWLSKNIDNIVIIGDNFGDMRIEPDGEVSIRIDKKFRGKGVGSEALKILEIIPGKFYAKIVYGNNASYHLFRKSGFVATRHYQDYIIMEKV